MSETETVSQTACDVVMASSRASDFKKSFICANDQLHEALVGSPLAILVYAFGVLLVMFLVQRASVPIKRSGADKTKNSPEDRADS